MESFKNEYERYKMKTIKSIVAMALALIAGVAHSGDSAPLLLDMRTGVRESDGVETLTYSSLWDGDANATVTIAQDGVALAENLTGEGELAWSVTRAGMSYTLTHTTFTNGVAGKVETATFKLTKDIASLTVDDLNDVTYTGSAIKPNLVVTDAACGYTLVNGTDYTLSYANNVNAGTATVTVTGMGNYTGSIQKTFVIARKSISGATVTLGAALTYTGSAQNQSVSRVTVDGLSATYEVSANTATAAGTYTLTVTGTGNFTGSTTKQFTVAPKPITDAMVGAVGNVTYTGAAFTPTPVVVDADRGVTLVNGTDYTLSYVDNVNAGTATVTVNGKGNYTGSGTQSFTIEKAVVEAPPVPYHIYDGAECKAVLEPNDLYTVVTNDCDLSTGVYEVGFELTDPVDYRWRNTDNAILLLSSQVTNVVISVGVSEIVREAFYGWSELKTVSIPDSVMRIGYDAFEGCAALETVVSNGLVLYQGWCFGFARNATGETPVVPVNGQDVSIPEGVRGIAAGAFEGEWGIDSVAFPSTLRFVGEGAFRDCTGIEDIVLPDGVVAVGREAFRNCTYAQGLSLPGTLKEIGEGAFANCSMLAGVALPDGVLDVGGGRVLELLADDVRGDPGERH